MTGLVLQTEMYQKATEGYWLRIRKATYGATQKYINHRKIANKSRTCGLVLS